MFKSSIAVSVLLAGALMFSGCSDLFEDEDDVLTTTTYTYSSSAYKLCESVRQYKCITSDNSCLGSSDAYGDPYHLDSYYSTNSECLVAGSQLAPQLSPVLNNEVEVSDSVGTEKN